MNRSEIKTRFREENPEVTDRVITDTVLNSWLLVGNLEFSTATRIVSEVYTFSSVVGISQYDLLAEIPNFIDVDEMPGGGVAYDDKRLVMVTRSLLDRRRSSWRTNSVGVPRRYYRRNQFITFEKPASEIKDITVDAIIKPDDFDDDNKTPFNELDYLEPFHYGMVLYLNMRAKKKEGKGQEETKEKKEYEAYVKWTKKIVQGGKISKIQITPYQSFPDSIYR